MGVTKKRTPYSSYEAQYQARKAKVRAFFNSPVESRMILVVKHYKNRVAE